MRLNSITQVGTNRGGHAVEAALARSRTLVDRVTVIDPKEGRAGALADRWAERGSQVTVIDRRVENTFDDLDGRVLATVDDVRPMARLLALDHPEPMYLQGIGREASERTLPTPPVGLRTVGVRGRDRQREQELWDTLAQASPPRSSAAIREDALAAESLRSMRDKTSRATVAALLDEPRTVDAPHLSSLLWRGTEYPLAIVRSDAATAHERIEEALDLAHDGRVLAIALVKPNDRVDLLVVRMDATAGPRLRMRFTFEVPRARPVVAPAPAAPSIAVVVGTALVTAIVGALLAPPAPATFTD